MADVTLILSSVIGALSGALITTVTTRHFGKKARQRESCWELYRKYHEIEFRFIRKSVMETKNNWDHVKAEIMPFLLNMPPEKLPKETVDTNGLTRRQNLSVILYFWSQISVGMKDGFIDKKLTKKLFTHLFSLDSDFFEKIISAYKNDPFKHEIPPIWLEAIPDLKELFSEK